MAGMGNFTQFITGGDFSLSEAERPPSKCSWYSMASPAPRHPMAAGLPFGIMKLGLTQMAGFESISGRESEAGVPEKAPRPASHPPNCWLWAFLVPGLSSSCSQADTAAESDLGALKEGLTLLGGGPLAQTQPWKTGMMRYVAPSALDPSIPSLFHARTHQGWEGQQVWKASLRFCPVNVDSWVETEPCGPGGCAGCGKWSPGAVAQGLSHWLVYWWFKGLPPPLATGSKEKAQFPWCIWVYLWFLTRTSDHGLVPGWNSFLGQLVNFEMGTLCPGHRAVYRAKPLKSFKKYMFDFGSSVSSIHVLGC